MAKGLRQMGKVEVEEGDYYTDFTHIYSFDSLQKPSIFISECSYFLLVRTLSTVFMSLSSLSKISKTHYQSKVPR